MKILIISQYFYPENFKINDVALTLKEKGYEVEVLTGIPNYPSGNLYDGFKFWSKNDSFFKGIKVYRAKLIPRKRGGALMISLNYLSFVFFGFFKLMTINKKFDKIITFAPSPITVGILGSIASIKYNAKSLLWVQDLWPESVKIAGGVKNPLILYFLDSLTRAIYKFTDLILVQSEFFEEYLINQRVSKNKIKYLPNYAEEFYKIVEPDKMIKKSFGDGFAIMFAGNIGEAQNLNVLVDAANILKDDQINVKFILIGEGRYKDLLKQYIEKLNLEDLIIFKGYIDPVEIPEYFASADALFLSLKSSKIFSLTIPSKLQTYMACARPIIGSIDGVSAKIINDSKSGFTCEPENPKLLAQIIKQMTKLSAQERIEMSKNGRKYYLKNFDKNIVINKLITEINQ